MLSVHNISKSYGITPVLKNISFNLNSREIIGLVGPNGCGKTTLLRILAGELTPDSGTVALPSAQFKPGYLPQALTTREDETVAEFIQHMQGDLGGLTSELEELATRLSKSPRQNGLQARYDSVLAQIERVSSAQGAVQSTLSAFELDTLRGDLPVAALSGGQKTRLGLAGLILSNSELLLLDEPTNHLDFAMLDWLENWLTHSEAAVLVVSHDRYFLDNTAQSILEIDGQTHQGKMYAGNYSDYLLAKEAEKAQQWQEYTDQQTEIGRLQTAASHYRKLATFKKGGKADSGDKFAKGFFANRSLATVRRAKSVEKRIHTLLTDEAVDKPRSSWQMKMNLADISASSRLVLSLTNLSVGYAENTLLTNINRSIRSGERVLIVGPNGCGKTTLLRTIAGQIPPLQGRVYSGPSVRLGYMAQDQSENLDPSLTVLQSLQRVAALNDTNARAMLHKYLFSGDEALLPVGQCSFGMRSRLVLACLVAQGCNFLLLDEPLNHLDIPSRTQFEHALTTFEGTILAVSHDRYFIQRFATTIWEIDSEELVVDASSNSRPAEV